MGAFVSKQPNGLYCRFSTVTDTISHKNLTKDQMIDLLVKIERERLEDLFLYELYPFDEVIENFVPANNTVEEFNQMLKDMGSDVQLDPDNYNPEDYQ